MANSEQIIDFDLVIGGAKAANIQLLGLKKTVDSLKQGL